MEYQGLFIAYEKTCPHRDGCRFEGADAECYYCRVYDCEDMAVKADELCVRTKELRENPDVEYWVKKYIDASDNLGAE